MNLMESWKRFPKILNTVNRVKRVSRYLVNFIFALIVIGFLSPLFLLIIFFYLINRKKPFFLQDRIGKAGEIFKLIKFQTFAHFQERSSNKFSIFLRKYRIDELPQLFNVLKGDMNIIGSRPVTPEIYHKLKKRVPNYDFRHKYKPGITGYAQVKMGYARTIEEEIKKFDYDRYYIENQSIWLDFKILFMTVGCVLRGEGE